MDSYKIQLPQYNLELPFRFQCLHHYACSLTKSPSSLAPSTSGVLYCLINKTPKS